MTRSSRCSLSILTVVIMLAVFATVPAARAKLPEDQIKSAGAIELTTDLVDKMDTVAKAVRADDAARTEFAGVKETDMDASVAAIKSKCPKTMEHFKAAEITPDELMKGVGAMLACFMDEKGELASSDNETAKANAEFVKENKDRCDKVGGEVMAMSMDPSITDLDHAKKP